MGGEINEKEVMEGRSGPTAPQDLARLAPPTPPGRDGKARAGTSQEKPLGVE